MSAKPVHIAILVHYFPPINSSGAKRFEAMSKYFARAGYKVSVITTSKSGLDGEFTEDIPPGVHLFELDQFGRSRPSSQGEVRFQDMYAGKPSLGRRLKAWVMKWFGQVPDPRLPFAISLASPFLCKDVRACLEDADIVIGSCPPWPMLLATFLTARRFNAKSIMDYRDPFSDCHEMPGGRFAKALERVIDRRLVRKANAVVAISEPIGTYYRQFNPATHVIMNGYDHEVVDSAASNGGWVSKSKTDNIIIRYMGLVSPGRVPHALLRALSNVIDKRPEIRQRVRFEYYGPTDVMRSALDSQYPKIRSLFSFHASVPYQVSLRLSLEADYLLFCETSSTNNLSAQGILTTKLFEYIATGRPIVAEIDQHTLAGKLIVEAHEQHIVSTDQQVFESLLMSDRFLNPEASKPSPIAHRLSRKYSADQYMRLIDGLIEEDCAVRQTATDKLVFEEVIE